MYLRDALGTMNNCYVAFVVNDGHVELRGAPTEKYGIYEEEE